MLTEYIKKMYEENDKKLSSLQREMDEIVTDINSEQASMERLQYEKKLDTNIFSPRKIDTKADEKINDCRIKIKALNQRMEYVSQMVEECLNNRKELTVLLKESQEKEETEETEQIEETLQEISSIQQTLDHTTDDLVNAYSTHESEKDFIRIVESSSKEVQDNNISHEMLKSLPDIRYNIKSENMSDVPLDEKDDGTLDQLVEIYTDENIDRGNEAFDENKNNFEVLIEMQKPEETSELGSTEDMQMRNQNSDDSKKRLLEFLNDLYKHNEIALALLNSNKNRCKVEIRNSMSMIREFTKKVENGDS